MNDLLAMAWNVLCYEFLLHPFFVLRFSVCFFTSFLQCQRQQQQQQQQTLEKGHKHIRKQFVHAPFLLPFLTFLLLLLFVLLPLCYVFFVFIWMRCFFDKQNKVMNREIENAARKTKKTLTKQQENRKMRV